MAALRGLSRGLFWGLPLQTAAFVQPKMAAAVKRLLAEERPDLVHLQLARMAPLYDPQLPSVIDLVDALSLNMTRRFEADPHLVRFVAWFEGRRMRQYEKALCARWPAATVVSKSDLRAIGPYPRLRVISNGVDLARFPFSGEARPAKTLVFTGNLGYFPNRDAVQFFVREILPRVRRRAPDVRLHLVGARPPAEILRLRRTDPAIEVSPNVPEIAPALHGAAVAVAPIRAGSGQLLKVLEAMASGTPLVATPRAVEGVAVELGRHVLVASTPDSFAEAILSLFNDPGLGRSLAREARSLVEERYTWEHSVSDLERLYLSLVPETQSQPSSL